ncbi:uncharacterized protein LOC110432825 isoform X2 [Sorghum bicolor]|uniref:uncharacterized protein LOC110432825 isoform X2 n=1 Tax=Sorghum bicolor TaxID=4558 RepID=UPI000B426188|nr:uncharacterized protein LOC110432825 isoform X2 [Sorghum bicolor]|eukprot:XP_021309385.1 uncharacterized protein LOC110432825 isoform X2 [Sorghum bicolor]
MIHPHGNISASVTCSDFARFQDLVELVHCMAVAHVFCIVHLCHMKQHLRFYFGLTTSQIYSHSSAEKLCCHLILFSDEEPLGFEVRVLQKKLCCHLIFRLDSVKRAGLEARLQHSVQLVSGMAVVLVHGFCVLHLCHMQEPLRLFSDEEPLGFEVKVLQKKLCCHLICWIRSL